MGFRKKDARKSDNRSKAKVIMGKPASQLSKEEKKILSARMAEIRSANGGKNTVQLCRTQFRSCVCIGTACVKCRRISFL